MGTSTSYQAAPSPEWKIAKGNFTRFMSEGGGAGGGVAGVVDSYVRAQGGATALADSVTSAKNTMKRLGSFLGNVAQSGFEGALKRNGLGDLVGQGPEAVLLGMADLICVAGATHDEADARHAAIEVFNSLLDEVDSEEELASLIEGKANGDGVRELFERYVVQFVYGKLMRELGERAESAPVDTPTKRAHSSEILDYINTKVKLEIEIHGVSTLDFNGEDGEKIVNQVLQGTYEVFVL